MSALFSLEILEAEAVYGLFLHRKHKFNRGHRKHKRNVLM